MAIGLKFKLTTRPRPVTAKEFTAICAQARGDGVIHWHTKYLPLHFQEFSIAKYAMKRRGKKYERWKRYMAASGKKHKGETIKKRGRAALVLTGLFERYARKRRPVQITASRAKIIMVTPSYIRKTARGRPWEATTVIDSEEWRIREVVGQGIEARIKAKIDSETKTI